MRSSRTRRPLHQQGAEQADKPFFSKKHEDVKKKDDVFFQTKLAVGEKGDKFEQEADKVADKVQKKAEEEKEKPAVQKKEEEKKEPGIQKMDKKEEEKPAQKKGAPDEKDKEATKVNKKEEEKQEAGIQKKDKKEEEKPVQKKGAPDEKDKEATKVNKKEEEKKEPGIQKMEKKEEQPVQKMSDGDKKEEKPVQKQEDVMMAGKGGGGGHAVAKASVEEQIKQSKGKGQALPDETRALLESQLHVDLGQVRVHTGADAVAMNKELNSLAFANGFDIYFNEGMYQPGTAAGKSLIAHEVTHVIQQTGISQKPAEKTKEKEKK